MIGVFVSLMILIKAPMPPLSPWPSPSTSSIMITLFCVASPPTAAASELVLFSAFLTPAVLK